MTCEELAAAVEQNLSMPIVVWSNDGYQEIREYMDSKGLPTIGCTIYNPEFKKIAEAFGAHGRRPQSAEELREALEFALQADGPTIIEIDEKGRLVAITAWPRSFGRVFMITNAKTSNIHLDKKAAQTTDAPQ